MKCRSTIFVLRHFVNRKRRKVRGVKSEGESESEDAPSAGAGVSKKKMKKIHKDFLLSSRKIHKIGL